MHFFIQIFIKNIDFCSVWGTFWGTNYSPVGNLTKFICSSIMVNIDFTNLNDVYHLSMILIGFGGLVVAALSLRHLTSKTNKQTISSAPKTYKKTYSKKKK